MDGRTEIYLTPLELLDRLAQLITPPRIHKHRYCGVLAPNAKLRQAVIETAGPAGATLQVLQEAPRQMGLEEATPVEEGPRSRLSRTAARCWGPAADPHLRVPSLAMPPLWPAHADHRVCAGSAGDDWPEIDQSVETPRDAWD